jgi:hypothetical protein
MTQIAAAREETAMAPICFLCKPGERGLRAATAWPSKVMVMPMLAAAFLVLASTSGLVAATNDRAPASRGGIQLPGRVVDADTQKPIAGAMVTISRVNLAPVPGTPAPGWVGDTIVTTDADGRFTLDVPADQIMDRRIGIQTAFEHPDFIAVAARGATPLAKFIDQWQNDEYYIFQLVPLVRGVEYSGLLLDPAGKPAANVPFEMHFNIRRSLFTNQITINHIRRTDADGRFRFRAEATNGVFITFEPDQGVALKQEWNALKNGPDAVVSTDLGKVTLETHPSIKGRVLDIQGKPIAGLEVCVATTALSGRTATTDVRGEFAVPAPAQGVWDVRAAVQDLLYYPGVDAKFRSLSDADPIICPSRVHYVPGQEPQPLELHEVPSVTVPVSATDSRGKPLAGRLFGVSGQLANERPAVPWPALGGNVPPAVQLARPYSWGCQVATDAQGRARLRVPKGLLNPTVNTMQYDPDMIDAIRLPKRRTWYAGSIPPLQSLDDIRDGIELVANQAATVRVTVRTDDDEFMYDGRANAILFDDDLWYSQVNSAPDTRGRCRLYPLLPHRDYNLVAQVGGYVHNTVERRRFDEGSFNEVTLIVRKQPKLLAPGDVAPMFAVRTLDGATLSLADLHGKCVLLHLWLPVARLGDIEHVRLKRVFDRFGRNPKFAMLSVGYAPSHNAARKEVADHNLGWPHSLLPYRWYDPILMDYRNASGYGSCLIGPDGKVLATNLSGDSVLDAVAEALGAK